MTEKEKFYSRLEVLRKKLGLQWIYVSCDCIDDDVKIEQLYAELNRMHDAPDVEDVEVLGKYSPVLIFEMVP